MKKRHVCHIAHVYLSISVDYIQVMKSLPLHATHRQSGMKIETANW